MKNVTAFVGSAGKKNTYRAVVQFLNNLQELGDVETEIVMLSNYRLEFCRGCRLCFEKGEAFCPLKDDRDVLFDKISASDGVVFATPNYAWDMSGMMKAFLDRFGFTLHRPRYFGKAFTSIVTQAVGRGDRIVDTLDFTAAGLGFNTLKGMTVTGFNPRTGQQQKKIDRDLERQSRRFYALLMRPANSAPTLLQMMVFRFGRTLVKQKADPASLDYRYYADRGWFEADYYCPANLGVLKKAAGYLVDSLAAVVQSFI
ncbi:MAG TPA: flavodoxin family protein [Anaerolineaceae bacterium]|nr:flavodoxin family protein [Anaerolineaceae bacterium]